LQTSRLADMDVPGRSWCPRISICIMLANDGIIRTEWKKKEENSEHFGLISRKSSKLAVTGEKRQYLA
jgi:hypothetical protein